MSLPKFIKPLKKIHIPSLDRDVEFEPYTTADEKAIISMESASTYEKCKIQLDILAKCCMDKTVDFESLCVMEISWLFIQLRKISVSGTIDLTTKCQKCEQDVNISINIDDVTFNSEALKPLEFQLQTSEGPYILHCEHFRCSDLQYIDADNIKYDDLARYIRYMYQADGNNILELTPDEQVEVFLQLDASSAKKIADYSTTMPKMKYKIALDCPECGQHIEGELEDFFI